MVGVDRERFLVRFCARSMDVPAFLAKWLNSASAERANKDSFLNDLCDTLGVPGPDPTTNNPAKDRYVFEFPVSIAHAGDKHTVGWADLYRAGAFLLEAKQGGVEGTKKGFARRGTPTWTVEMSKAYGQALGYVRSLDKPPPFLIVADLGYCFDLYADFDGSRQYRPFPTAQQNRLFLADLAKHVELLRAVWEDPYSLDPSRKAARITREVAAHLAELAKRLETSGHKPEVVARFLMRSIFTMFAEDIGLLPTKTFVDALARVWIPDPKRFPGELEALWRAMNDGHTLPFVGKLLKFNGGLFRDQKAIALNEEQLKLLHEAAACDWRDVEPAIFGTLLERALDPRERHRLGAHFTPRAYVERLVRPTLEEPLRAEWEVVRAEVQRLVRVDDDTAEGAPAKPPKAGKAPKTPAKKGPRVKEAADLVRAFHRHLCAVRVLDPACGSGNFLYVAMELMKRIESEVLAQLAELRVQGEGLFLEGVTVTPGQFLGIEKKPWAKEIAELVLWIGFLQWHARTRRNPDGKVAWLEPVLQDLHNIECRDAVLVWDREVSEKGEDGKPLTRWDGVSFKKHPVTGADVPDENKRVAVTKLVNPRRAEWPKADFIVGNPPFLGTRRMRLALGDGYVEGLFRAMPEVPENADLVMYWWSIAAGIVRSGGALQFGLITTNSIAQTFNRAVVQHHMSATPPLALRFVIPDHPWIEASDGAAVRVAMTVGIPGPAVGERLEVESENSGPEGDNARTVRLSVASVGVVSTDLRVGASPAHAVILRANANVAFWGVKFYGDGFILNAEEASSLASTPSAPLLRPFVSGRDLTKVARRLLVIDANGLDEATLRREYPAAYQHLLVRVKPVREHNPRAFKRERWWIFGENQPGMRAAIEGLVRYVVTTETATHRVFQFIHAPALAEGTVAVIALDDAHFLGVLSSRVHVVWSLAAGGTLEDRPRYNKTVCFDPFPFPDATDSQRLRIRALADDLDAHRKARQAEHPELTMTGMYNVLAKLRAGEALTDKEKVIHTQGLVSVLRQLHDDLDAAVFDAYGWPSTLTDEEILERVVKLNAERAEEERQGKVRWLRPEYQNPTGGAAQAPLAGTEEPPEGDATPAAVAPNATPWPKKLTEQFAAVTARLQQLGGAATPAELAAGFKGAGEVTVVDILETLEGLGRVVAFDDQGARRWKAVATTA